MIGDKPSNWTCGKVSFALQGYLANHVWLKLPDGRILDATADQFNFWFPHKKYPKVHLGKPLEIDENAKPYRATGN